MELQKLLEPDGQTHDFLRFLQLVLKQDLSEQIADRFAVLKLQQRLVDHRQVALGEKPVQLVFVLRNQSLLKDCRQGSALDSVLVGA